MVGLGLLLSVCASARACVYVCVPVYFVLIVCLKVYPNSDTLPLMFDLHNV